MVKMSSEYDSEPIDDVLDVPAGGHESITASWKAEQLDLLLRVLSAANESPSVEEAFRRSIRDVCRYTGWPVGHVYLTDETAPPALKPAGLWHFDDATAYCEFKQATESTAASASAGLPDLVLEHRSVAWVSDLSEGDSPFQRYAAAITCGLNAGVAFPIWSDGEIVGVLEFYADDISVNDVIA